MSKPWEIEQKLNAIIDTKMTTLIKLNTSNIAKARTAYCKKHGIEKLMLTADTTKQKIKELKLLAQETEKAIKTKLDLDTWNWLDKFEENVRNTIPCLAKLQALKERVNMEILLSSSGKNMTELFTTLLKEIENV